MKKFFKEFKEFALKGNVMDMAIGVIIGAAFGNIVTALTESFINPLIAVIFGGNPEGGAQIGGQFTVRGVAFDYGAFLSAIVNFLIMALVLFIMLKAINSAVNAGKKLAKKDAKKEEAPAPEDSDEVKLLKEMVAIMKEQNPDAAKKAEEKAKNASKK